jgi:methionyl-tRNA synthetase
MEFLNQNLWLIILILAWTLPWKGVALWRASKNNDKWWFIAFLVINTMGILEILYIFVFGKDNNKQHEN